MNCVHIILVFILTVLPFFNILKKIIFSQKIIKHININRDYLAFFYFLRNMLVY